MPGRMDSAVPQSYTFFRSLYFIYRSIFEIYTIYLYYLSIYLSILSIYLSIYLVKINSTCTRCDCIVTQHLLYSGQLSQSLDPRALQNVILYTSGITILFIHMYFNTVPQIVEEQYCFQTLWKYKNALLKSIVHQFKLSSKITLKALFCSRGC